MIYRPEPLPLALMALPFTVTLIRELFIRNTPAPSAASVEIPVRVVEPFRPLAFIFIKLMPLAY